MPTYVKRTVVLFLLPLLAASGCGGGDEKQQAEPAPKPIVPQVAKVGVGKKGSKLRKRNDATSKMIAGPVVTLFNTKEKVAFEMLVPKALQFYNATNGRNPRSHKEFMEEIIKENQIVLPELPDGTKYEYRPKDGTLGKLWVVPK